MRRLGLSFVVTASLIAGCSAGSDDGAEGAENGLTAVSCSAEQQVAAFQKMVKAPISPPKLGGIDLAAGEGWKGLTIDEAEQTLCNSNKIGEDETTVTVGWGIAPNFQVVATYQKTTRKISAYQINRGYEGKLEFAARPTSLKDPSRPNPFGQHTYVIAPGQPILRDGQPWQINWKKSCGPGVSDCFDKQSTELHDALMFTFAPDMASTQESCTKDQTCLARSYSTGEGIIGVRPVGVYFYVPNVLEPAAASTPEYLYGFTLKTMAFSSADLLVKLDAEGPVARKADLGIAHSTCTLKVGLPFQSFLSDCVEILANPAQNALLRKKVLGNASRAFGQTATGTPTGTWLLDINGARPNFNSERFDETEPAAGSKMTELVLDNRSSGKVLNDWSADGSKQNLFATGSVYREYARLVQAFLNPTDDSGKPIEIGATQCLRPDPDTDPNWKPAFGCTGMEQLVTSAEASTAHSAGIARVSLGSEAISLGLKTVLKPGDPVVIFCSDPALNGTGKAAGEACTQGSECRSNQCKKDEFNGTQSCAHPFDTRFRHCGDDLNASGSVVAGTLAQITKVLGEGNAEFLPEAARDPQVYLRLWVKALVTYLRAAPNAPADLAEVAELAPTDAELTIEPAGGDHVKVKYKNRLELKVDLKSGAFEEVTYR